MLMMSESMSPAANGRILFVDKDSSMRNLMEMVVCDHFQLVTAGSAEEALILLKSEIPFDIVISGLTLFMMNGLEFLRLVGELYPQTVRILMSGGCGDTDGIIRAIKEGHIRRLILKPFHLSTLLDQLKSDLVSLRGRDCLAD